jgi:hypothetical protein
MCGFVTDVVDVVGAATCPVRSVHPDAQRTRIAPRIAQNLMRPDSPRRRSILEA